jgi:hypothetical protein
MEGIMDYGKLISRAFEVAWRYKALWLFGFLMALFSGDGGGGGNTGYNFRSEDFARPGQFPQLPQIEQNTILAIVALICCLALVWFLVGIYLRLVSRGALVGMVQQAEQNETPTIGSGWRAGSSRFLSLLGIALLINVPFAILALILVGIGVLPLILALGSASQFQRGIAPERIFVELLGPLFGSLALFCCAIAILVIIGLLLHPFYEFFVRACMLEGKGATEAIGLGYRRVRENLGNVAVLYLILIGLRIGFAIAVGIVAIPVALALAAIVVGSVVAGSVATAVILGACLGIPIALAFTFVEGLFLTFESAVWTEGYLAVLGKASAPSAAPAVVPA